MGAGLENLKIYQMAEALEIQIHEVTKSFPPDEKYRSVDQLRRSSASVANNIVEGYTRASNNEKIRYMYIAKGEAEETKRGILRSEKKAFLNVDTATKIADDYTELLKATSGYIRFLRKQP